MPAFKCEFAKKRINYGFVVIGLIERILRCLTNTLILKTVNHKQYFIPKPEGYTSLPYSKTSRKPL